jgi:hypothetical protein
MAQLERVPKVETGTWLAWDIPCSWPQIPDNIKGDQCRSQSYSSHNPALPPIPLPITPLCQEAGQIT